MKFETFVDIARTILPDVNANDIALRLNAYFDDIAMEIDIEKRRAEKDSEDSKTRYDLRSFQDEQTQEPVSDRFMRLLSVRISDIEIRHINEATCGDHCYKAKYDDLFVGIFAYGLSEGNPALNSLPAGRKIGIDYSARPVITIETVDMPAPYFHTALSWRLRADMWAEHNRWDMYGAFNRRYEQSFVRIKKHLRSGHGGWNPVNVRI